MTNSIQAQIVATLLQIEPFDRLDPATLGRLALGAHSYRVSRGEMLMQRGADPGGMYLVLDGEIKLFLMSSAGAEKIVRLVGRGDSFCEENILSDARQMLAAQATRDSIVLHLQRNAVQTAMASHPGFTMALVARLSERMRELVEGMEQCTQRSSTQRVAHYLVQHADCAGGEVRLPCDKQTIASQLNLTPETFSRVLNRLTREGFIVPRGRRAITLKNLPQLELIAA